LIVLYIFRLATTSSSAGSLGTSKLSTLSSRRSTSLRSHSSCFRFRWLCCLSLGFICRHINPSILRSCWWNHATNGAAWQLQCTTICLFSSQELKMT